MDRVHNRVVERIALLRLLHVDAISGAEERHQCDYCNANCNKRYNNNNYDACNGKN